MKTSSHPVLKSLITPIALGLLVPIVLTAYTGCKKDEPPPPLPSAAPTAEPSAPLQLVVEDSGPDADADAEAGKPTGPYKPAASLKACCAALAQNAENAPEPTKSYMKTAAAGCYGAVAQGKDKGSILAIVRGALGGAGMPAACR
jgi:hypothetical protein